MVSIIYDMSIAYYYVVTFLAFYRECMTSAAYSNCLLVNEQFTTMPLIKCINVVYFGASLIIFPFIIIIILLYMFRAQLIVL